MKCIVVLCVLVAFDAVSINALHGSNNEDYSEWDPSPHLAGAERVPVSQYQYSMSLRFGRTELDKKDYRYCGAVRLSDLFALTAAECLESPRHIFRRIIYPVNDTLRTVYRNRRDLQYLIHPNYNPSTKENNIAIVKINMFALLNQSNPILPILPVPKDRYKTFIDNSVFISSYQHLDRFPMEERNERVFLIRGNTKVIDPSLCRKYFATPADKNKYICLSGARGMSLSQDDIGAPLLIEDNGRLKLIGIATSLGIPAKPEPGPMLFTRILPLTGWIHKETGNSLPR